MYFAFFTLFAVSVHFEMVKQCLQQKSAPLCMSESGVQVSLFGYFVFFIRWTIIKLGEKTAKNVDACWTKKKKYQAILIKWLSGLRFDHRSQQTVI